MQLNIEIPDEYLSVTQPNEIVKCMKLNVALMMYQSGEVSVEAASKFAEVSLYDFFGECKKRLIEVQCYDASEVFEDFATYMRAVS